MELTLEEKKFLKGLKNMKQADDNDVRNIFLLYRKVINKPEIVKEYESCNCPSLLREMAFELTLYSLKNKQLLK